MTAKGEPWNSLFPMHLPQLTFTAQVHIWEWGWPRTDSWRQEGDPD